MTSKLEELNHRHKKILEDQSQMNDLVRKQMTLWKSFQTDQAELREWFRLINEEKLKLDLSNLKSNEIQEKMSNIKVRILGLN